MTIRQRVIWSFLLGSPIAFAACLWLWGCQSQPKVKAAKPILELPPVPVALSMKASTVSGFVSIRNTNLCAVVWAQNSDGTFSNPTNVCVVVSNNEAIASWDPPPPLTNCVITNYVLGWSRSAITNVLPASNIQWTNTGLSTMQTFLIVQRAPMYGLIFLQASTNGLDFYDLTITPYLRLTNGTGGLLPWQWFRSRTESTTNWK